MLTLFKKQKPLICAIMKLEARYILEWVAWHQLQGFDIVIADNCTQGDQTTLLQCLENAGQIHYLDCRDFIRSPQMPVYEQLFWFAVKHRYRIIGYLDADEFLDNRCGDQSLAAETVAAILHSPFTISVQFQWLVFGSNGLREYEEGLVTERFTRRDYERSLHYAQVKSFGKTGSLLAVLMLLGFGNFKRLMINAHRFRVRNPLKKPPPNPSMRIRHYAIKSFEEFEFKHQRRGDAFWPDAWAQPESVRRYWDQRDLNFVEDPVDRKFADKLKVRVAELEQLANAAK